MTEPNEIDEEDEVVCKLSSIAYNAHMGTSEGCGEMDYEIEKVVTAYRLELTAERDKMIAELVAEKDKMHANELRLIAEVERLREALEKITMVPLVVSLDGNTGEYYTGINDGIKICLKIARKALASVPIDTSTRL